MKRDKSCAWPASDPLMTEYHDHEWGVPLHDDRKLFEFFILGIFQAGLSWKTVLYKRENFRKAFSRFNPAAVAGYGKKDVVRLLADEGIIRNRMKIEAAIHNAQMLRGVIEDFGSFSNYCWSFTSGKVITNRWKSMSDLPGKTNISDVMSRDMKERGFKFAGSTICYAFMQAAGMVNDHQVSCFRYREIKAIL